MMGAPTVMVEKLPRGDEIDQARSRRCRRYIGRRVDAHDVDRGRRAELDDAVHRRGALGIPLVDADGMGRAFPEIQMVHADDVRRLGDADGPRRREGQRGDIDTIDNRWTERLARTLTIDMGCSAMIALYR